MHYRFDLSPRHRRKTIIGFVPLYTRTGDRGETGLFDGARLVGGAHLALRRVRALPLETSKLLALMLPDHDRERALDAILAAIERLARKHFVFETEVQLRIPQGAMLPELGAEDVARALEAVSAAPVVKG